MGGKSSKSDKATKAKGPAVVTTRMVSGHTVPLNDEERRLYSSGPILAGLLQWLEANGMRYTGAEAEGAIVDTAARDRVEGWIRYPEPGMINMARAALIHVQSYSLCFSWDDTLLQFMVRHYLLTGNLPRAFGFGPDSDRFGDFNNLFRGMRGRGIGNDAVLVVAARDANCSPDYIAYALRAAELELEDLEDSDEAANDTATHVSPAESASIKQSQEMKVAIAHAISNARTIGIIDPLQPPPPPVVYPAMCVVYDDEWMFYNRRKQFATVYEQHRINTELYDEQNPKPAPAAGSKPDAKRPALPAPLNQSWCEDYECAFMMSRYDRILLNRWYQHVLRWVLEIHNHTRAEIYAFNWVPLDFVQTEKAIALARAALEACDVSGAAIPLPVVAIIIGYIECRIGDARMLKPADPHTHVRLRWSTTID